MQGRGRREGEARGQGEREKQGRGEGETGTGRHTECGGLAAAGSERELQLDEDYYELALRHLRRSVALAEAAGEPESPAALRSWMTIGQVFARPLR